MIDTLVKLLLRIVDELIIEDDDSKERLTAIQFELMQIVKSIHEREGKL